VRRYYRAQGPLIDASVGSERRWVIYNGYADASKVPPGWRGWLCHGGKRAVYSPGTHGT
jgi:NADH:ubiquinone oxidoreductase subunit